MMRFGATNVDKHSYSKIKRGRRLIEIIRQPANRPIDFGAQVIIIYMVTEGYMDVYTLKFLSYIKGHLVKI